MNETMLQGFEWYLPEDKSHWNRLADLAGELADLGFSWVWLPPAYKGVGGGAEVGYGVYDMYDLGEFDQKGTVPTKYGTRAEYLSAAAALKAKGVRVIADVVFNHRAGGDGTESVAAYEADPKDRGKVSSVREVIDAYTRFDFPGRAGKYSQFTWDHACFDGTDWDERTHRRSVFLFEGKSWDSEVDRENGNFDYLMCNDLDIAEPKVVEELGRWGRWYIDTLQPDGFRLDAVKHINKTFFGRWIEDMREYAGRPIFAVGEYWHSDVNKLTEYLSSNLDCMSLFDVPLHYAFMRAGSSNGTRNMGELFSGTLLEARPDLAVTFVDNHDTQPGQALESFVESWFKPIAYAVILLIDRGLPCVFWGDLFGIPKSGIGPVEGLRELLEQRRTNAYGPERDWFDAPDVVGFTREGDGEHPGSGLAVILSDGPGGNKRMELGPKNAGRTMRSVLGGGPDVTLDSFGAGDFEAPGGGVRVYVFAV